MQPEAHEAEVKDEPKKKKREKKVWMDGVQEPGQGWMIDDQEASWLEEEFEEEQPAEACGVTCFPTRVMIVFRGVSALLCKKTMRTRPA